VRKRSTVRNAQMHLRPNPSSGDVAPERSSILPTKAAPGAPHASSAAGGTPAEPTRGSIDDLPAVAPRAPEAFATKLRADLQSRRALATSAAVGPQPRSAISSMPPAPHPHPNADDPFASRR
jgi:hypothetical protein